MDMMMQAGAQVEFLDPHIDSIPHMREYPHLFGRKAVQLSDIDPEHYDAILISTDHDAVDYVALSALGLPAIDTRNAFATRGLPMDKVVKA